MHRHRRILLSSAGSNGPHLSPPPPPSPYSPSHLASHVIILVASGAAASVFLALVYYAVLRHRLRRPPPPPGTLTAGREAALDGDSEDADHPFWHVKTVGLDDAAINALGSYAHRGADRPSADCSVCLGEVIDGEIVRLLPKCGHVFHVDCVDTWLRCNVSCPLCRAAVADAAAVDDADANVDGGSEESPQSDEEAASRVLVESSPEIPDTSETAADVATAGPQLDSVAIDVGVLRVDEEKEGDCSNFANSSKDEGFEKGPSGSGSGRSSLFSRLGRARSSSVLPL